VQNAKYLPPRPRGCGPYDSSFVPFTFLSVPDPNLNLRRRALPGLFALLSAPLLRLMLLLVRNRRYTEEPLLVFSSYMVGDLFMALPALKRLAAEADIRVICRPDCAEILRREGLVPVPFDNAFFTSRTPAAFLRTLREAWRLRPVPKCVGLDLDADPRTALWLRVAGCWSVETYRRPYGFLFDSAFPLPPTGTIHQADRDMAVVEKFLRIHGGIFSRGLQPVARATTPGIDTGAPSPSPWILSVWTRKAAKNWPLEHWNDLMERMKAEGVPFAVLHAPDGNASYRSFRARWQGRAEFVHGPLEDVAERVRAAAGVIATDNFLGHMAGYYGRPVLWINIASPAAQVAPRGPRVFKVEAEDPRRPGSLAADAVWREFAALRAEARRTA
jgi:ADP-heptose:LPS heptosyltransferase